MINEKYISVVIPVFNEAPGLQELHQRIIKSMQLLGQNYEIIFVDDGSSDNSFGIIKDLTKIDKNVTGLRLRKNFGKSAALAAGFSQARGKLIATLDSDLQDLPEELPRLINALSGGADVVCGWRYQRQDSLAKRFLSSLFNHATRTISGLKIHDINCGLKVFRREVIEEIPVYGELHRYLPVMAFYKGFQVDEIKIKHAPRRFGRSKYGLNRIWRGLLDLITVVFLFRYLKKPLHLFGPAGILLSLAGLGIVLYLTILRIRFGHIMEHRPLLLGGILLVIVGVQFVSLGLLAEMLTHIHPQEKKEYSVAEKTGT